MRAVVITIGDELLIGQILNTNAAWLGEELGHYGIDVVRTVTAGDDLNVIKDELARALADADLVITTGGLGPTHDDLTREALAACFGVALEFHPAVYEKIRRRFERRSRAMPESNRKQALVPAGFTVLNNPEGTAPGLWRALATESGTCLLAVLPGVPHEMKSLFRNEVWPRLLGRSDLRLIAHRTLRTAGIGESSLQEEIGDLADLLSDSLRLAYLPGTSGVRLRLSAYGRTKEEVATNLERLDRRIRERLGAYVYGVDEDALENVVGRLLKARGWTIAVAESCTGGHVAHQITNVPGSSAYMIGGVIAYSNRLKTELLGIDEALLKREGVVSEAVAREMAASVRVRLSADVGVSTTGIAGPAGGRPGKPVGTVWIGYADACGAQAVLLRLAKERVLNKELTTTALLDLVRRQLLAG